LKRHVERRVARRATIGDRRVVSGVTAEIRTASTPDDEEKPDKHCSLHGGTPKRRV